MTMKTLILIFSLAFIFACTQQHVSPEQNALSQQELTYGYFADNLKPDMTYEKITKTFGTPARDIGSGIHIYVYPLTDSTEIWIGFTDKIMYAKQVDKNRNVIKTIP